jgi:hypothetical protein
VTEDMASDGLRYDRMVEDALRSVVRRALIHIGREGLPGNHHFYITFRTDHKDVEIPAALRERYPGEMTIVLQHQFWGLEIGEEQFCVTLSFADVPHRLVVSFAAVTAFADPSVRFGLQFDVETADTLSGGNGQGEGPAPFDSPVGPRELSGDLAAEDNDAFGDGKTEADEEAQAAKQPGAEKVVTLDAFRKK